MAKVTPDEFVEKHARRLKAATDDIRRGVEKVTEAPTLKAAAKAVKMRERLMAAIDSGKWERGLKRVSLEEWKDKMITKGVGRIAAGVDGSAAKIRAFAEELLPHIDAGVSQVKKMPDVTLEDNIQRMTAMVRHMAKFQRRG
ncbi:MAG: hypothetical protein ACE5K8_04660 [Candidatus Zixiibacteriota bacterium]